jgi:hypothetical protein
MPTPSNTLPASSPEVRGPFHPADPFRSADWRHQRCAGLLDLGRQPSRRRDDAATWAGWRYLAGLCRAKDARGRERVIRRYTTIHAAHELRRDPDTLRRCGVEGYLLGGVPPPEVDARFQLPTGTAQSYGDHFFDVQRCLQARDYLVNVVIQVHSRQLRENDAEVFIRLYGLFGGRYVVDALLDYFGNPIVFPLSLEGLGDDERARLRQRLLIRLTLYTRCLPVSAVDVQTWDRLSRLAERLGDGGNSNPASMEVDIAEVLSLTGPVASEVPAPVSPEPVRTRDAA